MAVLTVLYFTLVAAIPALAASRCTRSTALFTRSGIDDLTGTGTDLSGLTPIMVNVFMHAVANSSTSPAYISEETMNRQLEVLNQDFGPANISFTLRNRTWTINQDWANGIDGAYPPMMKELHQGGTDALNIYFVDLVSRNAFAPPYDNIEEDLLGIASDPWNASIDDPTSSNCVLLAGTVPGGYRKPANMGRTATHEVGHWFGLYHPFEGGCVLDPNGGDRVSDTPAAANGTFGCESYRDSCPDLPGADPVRNYMGYSDDACMDEFTPGQIVRMHAVWNRWRHKSPTTVSTANQPSQTTKGSSNGSRIVSPIQHLYLLYLFYWISQF